MKAWAVRRSRTDGCPLIFLPPPRTATDTQLVEGISGTLKSGEPRPAIPLYVPLNIQTYLATGSPSSVFTMIDWQRQQSNLSSALRLFVLNFHCMTRRKNHNARPSHARFLE